MNEAQIHLELYRHLKNLMPFDASSEELRYLDVLPEVIVSGNSANLLLEGEVEEAGALLRRRGDALTQASRPG